MKIYNYDENGLYVGSSDADESPLEKDMFLIPAFATTIEPLAAKDGFDIYWNNDKWQYREIPKQKPEQPNAYSVWDEESWEWVDSFEIIKSIRSYEIQSGYQSSVRAMAGNADTAEMASWTKQEAEARAWAADNNAVTTIIDNLLIGRNMGESKADLVAKIITKADAYAVAYAQVLGQYHAKQKALAGATTVEEVLAL